MSTLPEGWTGNGAVMHRTIGLFQLMVYRTNRGLTGRSFAYRITFRGTLREGSYEPPANDHLDAEEARGAALTKMREIAREILAALE